MRDFTKDKLLQLSAEQGGPCLSLYLAVHPTSTDSQPDKIQLKNLLREAKENLLQGWLPDEASAKMFLKPFEVPLDDHTFWADRSRGLAIFLNQSGFVHYWLPVEPLTHVIVAPRFHVKPLLPILMENGTFYILALSQNQVRLVEATRFEYHELSLANAPKRLSETWPDHELEIHRTAARSAGPTGSGDATMYYGFGARAALFHDELLKYCRQIDRSLNETVRDKHAPLVLAAVEYLYPIYREANSYARLVQGEIAGNPEELSLAVLHERAWPLVRPHFLREQEAAKARYAQLVSAERASSKLGKVLPAAHEGRVESIFVALDRQRWGVFDLDTRHVEINQQPQHGDVDLLEIASLETLRNGGTVFAVHEGEMPDDTLVAAIFRY